MSQSSKKSSFGLLIPILLGLVAAKGFWLALELTKLPKKGIEPNLEIGVKPLYYRYTLATKKEKVKTVAKNNKNHYIKPKPKPEEIRKFILKGIFDSTDKKLIVIKYRGKSYVLAMGEMIEGYKFTKIYPDYVIFTKNGKEYELNLYKKGHKEIKKAHLDTIIPNRIRKKSKAIEKEGDTTYISRNLFNKYKSNFAEIQKNIGVVPYMEGGKLKGFKISFVRKGSDFDKLGVKRGDIILSVNGEPLNNFKVPMRIFNNLDTLTAATITIKRGNEIKELEYEVR